MPKFKSYDVAELLGFSRIAEVQDAEIWNHLLTPQVKALLGRITHHGEPQLMETVEGHFPGDEVTNLNKHLLFGKRADMVRFPYLSTWLKTEYGALIIKRDAVKTKVFGWVGDVTKGKAELIFISALRDRRFDGTARANDTSLLFYPYDDPVYHKPLHPELRSVEVSIYSFLPNSSMLATTGQPELQKFVEQPFSFLDQPETFLKYFNWYWNTDRAPGQLAAPIPDVSRLCLPGFDRVARAKGYDLVEAATSHYHVAMWFKSRGYRYSYEKDVRTMAALAAGIKRLKDNGVSLTRPQESWVCVLQSLRPLDLIPHEMYMQGAVWPQDNLGPELLWMNKPLTEKAAKLLAAPLDF